MIVTRRHFVRFVDLTSLAKSAQSIINVSMPAAWISASASSRDRPGSTVSVSAGVVVGSRSTTLVASGKVGYQLSLFAPNVVPHGPNGWDFVGWIGFEEIIR